MPDGLNPQQREAVLAPGGPLLILAGAGTGKTRVITERIAHLLGPRRLPPEAIVAVTFTNKAAGEMKERIAARLGRRQCPKGLVVSTFHSLCVRMLRRDAERIGYRKGWTICDTGQQLGIVRRAVRSMAGLKAKRPDDVLAAISRLKTDGVTPRAYLRTATEPDEETIGHAYRRYQETLRATHTMDFDDLLVNALELLRGHEDVLAHWQDRAQHLLVDEFQDTSDVQFELLRLLAARHGNLCVVGDDDQSIYAWRGARPRNIVQFADRFPGATVIRLEQNYRSVNSVLRAANAVIANNEVRVGKTLWSALGDGEPIAILEADDPDDEAEQVVARIDRAVRDGDRPGEHAILVRTNLQARAFEEELRVRKLPYVVIGGQSFYDHKEVRDVLAYLGVLANPWDDASFLRIVNTPARGIGETSIARLVDAATRHRRPVAEILDDDETLQALPAAARAGAGRLDAALRELRRRVRADSLDGIVADLIDRIAYAEETEHLYSDAVTAAARLDLARGVDDSLRRWRSAHPDGTLSDFLTEAALDRSQEEDADERSRAGNAVRLITLHSAKGLEFPHVVLAGLQEGILPHQNSLADGDVSEERRLAYVGITRAQRTLTLSYAKGRLVRGKVTPAEPSRFLDEIPPELLDRGATRNRRDVARDHLRAIREALE